MEKRTMLSIVVLVLVALASALLLPVIAGIVEMYPPMDDSEPAMLMLTTVCICMMAVSFYRR